MHKILPLFLTVIAVGMAGLVFFLFFIPKQPSVKIFFIKGDKLEARSRPIEKNENPLTKSAFELLNGPTKSEEENGIFSEIPKGTKIISIRKSTDEVEINFNEKLKEYGGGSFKIRVLIAQIIYTFSEAAKVKKVGILINGKREIFLGGEGYFIDKPLSKEDIKF